MGRRGRGAWQGSPGKNPRLGEGPQRLPGRAARSHLSSAFSSPPSPHSLQDSPPAGWSPPPISKSTLQPPFPLPHQGRVGEPCSPILCWSRGNRGPNRALKRAVGAYPPEKGVGRAHFALNKGKGGALPFAPLPNTRKSHFLSRKGWHPILARKREPHEKEGTNRLTSFPLQSRETEPHTPSRNKKYPHHLRKQGHPHLRKTWGGLLPPKRQGLPSKGLEIPPPILPSRE